MLAALAHLNEVAETINRASSDPGASIAGTLQIIAGGVVELLADSGPAVGAQGLRPVRGLRPATKSTGPALPAAGVTAVIYPYDPARGVFDAAARVAAGAADAHAGAGGGDTPRVDGMGARALSQGRRILSYEQPGLHLHAFMAAQGACTGACYPLLVAGQPVGVLYVYLHEPRPFSPLELLLLDNYVNLAAMALHRSQQLTQVQRNLLRKEEELTRLRHAGLLISSRPRLEETLQAILHMALEVTNARYGIFRLAEPADANARGQAPALLVTRAIAGEDLGRPAVEALPINATSITGWVAKHRQPLCIADVRAGRWARLYYPLDHDLEMRSELAAPLIGANGRLEGVINLESPEVAAFSEEDSLLLQALATQAVIAIQDLRLLDALQETAGRLLAQPASALFARLVELACELLNLPTALLWTLDGDELVVQAGYPEGQTGSRTPVATSFPGRAILTRRPAAMSEFSTDAAFTPVAGSEVQLLPEVELLSVEDGGLYYWQHALAVPLMAGEDGTPLGALAVFQTGDQSIDRTASPLRTGSPYGTEGVEGRPSEWDVKVLTFLAHQAALAVQNAARQEALHLAQEQHAAAETFAALGDIAANLLHRLNNKIGAIPVRVEGIQDKCQPALAADAYLAANLAEIERSAVEALEALRDSLSYLRPIHVAPVELPACVAQALASVPVPPQMRVTVEGLDDLPPVMAGSQRLALVFVNLLENAVTAMQSAGAGEGVITIRGRTHRGSVEISVSDTGPGIAPHLHERIFEFNYSSATAQDRSLDFAQDMPGADRASQKLGFGLWWVRTIMARFGGAISVESDGKHGATFTLRLPVGA